MEVVHSGIEDGDDHAAGVGLRLPRLRGVDVRVRRPSSLSGVVQAPLLGEFCVIGERLQSPNDVVRLRVEHLRIRAEVRHRPLHRYPGRNPEQVHPDAAIGADAGVACGGYGPLQARLRHSRAELHEHVLGVIGQAGKPAVGRRPARASTRGPRTRCRKGRADGDG